MANTSKTETRTWPKHLSKKAKEELNLYPAALVSQREIDWVQESTNGAAIYQAKPEYLGADPNTGKPWIAIDESYTEKITAFPYELHLQWLREHPEFTDATTSYVIYPSKTGDLHRVVVTISAGNDDVRQAAINRIRGQVTDGERFDAAKVSTWRCNSRYMASVSMMMTFEEIHTLGTT